MKVSSIGFGAWAIGGPASAGKIPIGWGDADDRISLAALRAAMDHGITFFDTADFYGLGHSEKLLGQEFGNRDDVVIATKAGHRLDEEDRIYVDYSAEYIIQACEDSLRRLRREAIDFFQLHTARVSHFEQEECFQALETLKQQGKIRWWGVSLNTFAPQPEAEWLLEYQYGNGVQVVLNILNQIIVPYLRDFSKSGMGVIARMPIQFGLLTGKFGTGTTFPANDHRSFRLPPNILKTALTALKPIEEIALDHGLTMGQLALSYILGYEEVSTIIPGIRTPEQVRLNTSGLTRLSLSLRNEIEEIARERFGPVVQLMREAG